MGLVRSSTGWEAVETCAVGVGRAKEQLRGGAGEKVRQLLEKHAMTSGATARKLEYTWYKEGWTGPASLIDHMVLPV
eukprot:5743897-Lingulodinium_polyedra.AAC.1